MNIEDLGEYYEINKWKQKWKQNAEEPGVEPRAISVGGERVTSELVTCMKKLVYLS